jgi:hypothetical protein
MAVLIFTVCNVYLPPHRCYLGRSPWPASPSSLLLFYSWDTSMHIIHGALQMRTRGDGWQRQWYRELTLWSWTRVIRHTCLASGSLSLDLAMCRRAISAHFAWRLLADLCCSDCFPICLCSEVPFTKSAIQTGLWNRPTGPFLIAYRNWGDFSPHSRFHCGIILRNRASGFWAVISSLVFYQTTSCFCLVVVGGIQTAPYWGKSNRLKTFPCQNTENCPAVKTPFVGMFLSSVFISTPSTVVWERTRRISSKCTCTFILVRLVNGATVTSQDQMGIILSSYFWIGLKLCQFRSCFHTTYSTRKKPRSQLRTGTTELITSTYYA